MLDRLRFQRRSFWLLFTFSGGGLGADQDKEEDFESSMGGRVSFSAKTLRTQACHGGRSFSPTSEGVHFSWGSIMEIIYIIFTFFNDLQVFDENRLTRDDFLGRVELPLVSLPREAEVVIRSPHD